MSCEMLSLLLVQLKLQQCLSSVSIQILTLQKVFFVSKAQLLPVCQQILYLSFSLKNLLICCSFHLSQVTSIQSFTGIFKVGVSKCIFPSQGDNVISLQHTCSLKLKLLIGLHVGRFTIQCSRSKLQRKEDSSFSELFLRARIFVYSLLELNFVLYSSDTV